MPRIKPETIERKERLLKSARAGGQKPKRGSDEYDWLYRYISPTSRSFDAVFREKILPYWPIVTRDRAITEGHKQTLLAMAERGEPKPKVGTFLYKRMVSYIYKSSLMFDESFRDQLRAKSNWFDQEPKKALVVRQILAPITKESVLAHMRSGAPKPHHSSQTWQYVKDWAHPDSSEFDSDFLLTLLRESNWIGGFGRMKITKRKSA